MLATKELRKFWIDMVRDAVRYRDGLRARVPDVTGAADRHGMHVKGNWVYRRLEKLVELGYLNKRAMHGHFNSYNVTEKADKFYPDNNIHKVETTQ